MPIDFQKLINAPNKTPLEKTEEYQKWLESQPYYQDQKKIDELREYSFYNEVSDWEIKFINSVYSYACLQFGTLSPKQKEKVNEFHKKYIDVA